MEYLTEAAPVLLIRKDGRSVTTFLGDTNSIRDMLQELAKCECREACRQRKVMKDEQGDECQLKVTISREDGSPIFNQDQEIIVEHLTGAAPVLAIRRNGGSIERIGGDASWVYDMLQGVLERDREIEREIQEYERRAKRQKKE